ncbi:MAG TPA: hypothetical protein VMU17_00925, partial [Elusimicrobiota bacterium]|nr:hypothetical protein [Elusimicrobiota bacterium]
VTITPDAADQTLTLQPQTSWSGNTLMDIQISPRLQNIDGVSLDQPADVFYLTMLDQHQDNTILNPLSAPHLPAAAGPALSNPLSIHIPADTLSTYSAVLASGDPIHAPLQVDPALVQEANQKAVAAGGPYRTPIALQEIAAYDINGNPAAALSKAATLTMDYGGSAGAAAGGLGPVRTDTLSLYVLDQEHRLWVQMPASRNSPAMQTISAPITQFSVFALMGSGDGSTSTSHVYPVPWRPHGPNAGSGPGQTGTEGEGLTFTDLPPECTIKIYTIAGELVREIQHSDLTSPMGREPWDAKTSHGNPVASGVYLWRVQSSVDAKNGKLMIIR